MAVASTTLELLCTAVAAMNFRNANNSRISSSISIQMYLSIKYRPIFT